MIVTLKVTMYVISFLRSQGIKAFVSETYQDCCTQVPEIHDYKHYSREISDYLMLYGVH